MSTFFISCRSWRRVSLPFLIVFFTAATAMLSAQPAQGQPQFDFSEFKKIIVHEGGRVKPLDSYARTTLLVFSGRSTFLEKSAIEWLAETVFLPFAAAEQRLFKITFPEILFAIGVSPHKSKRYTFSELSSADSFTELRQLANAASQKEEIERTAADREFLRIYQNLITYYELMNSFLYALPLETFRISLKELREALFPTPELAQKQIYSYLELMERIGVLEELHASTAAKPKTEWVAFDFAVDTLYERYENFPKAFANFPFRMLPSFSHGKGRWFTPWQLFSLNRRSERGGEAETRNLVRQEIKILQSLAQAYLAGDAQQFSAAAGAFNAQIIAKAGASFSSYPVNLEVFYNALEPFYRSLLFYGGSLFLLLGVFLFSNRRRRWFYYGAYGALLAGLALSVAGIALRAGITHRPPITNLFETFIFVATICVGLAFLLERFAKKNALGYGLFSGAVCGLALLMMARNFSADGDTMEVLIAVLRSNFWLSTHVIIINLGYAGIVISGVIGHVYLAVKAFQKEDNTEQEKKSKRERLRYVFNLMVATQAFGLIATLIGTILGGIWADQSWGRFWGWDPKENGALLIVLWSAIIFHAYFGGLIKAVGYAAASIVGIIVVMMAWFGINLLGVGLHSYGFVSGVAYTLFAYVAVQLLVLSALLVLVEWRNRIRFKAQTPVSIPELSSIQEKKTS